MKNYFVFIFLVFQAFVVKAQETKTDTTVTSSPVTDRYEMLISKAADAVLKEDFDNAKALYTEALSVKPRDPFVVGMLENVNNNIKAREAARLKSLELKRKADINVLLNQAQAEVMARNYEGAKTHYTEVLALQPVKSQEDFVKQKLRAIDFALQNSNKSTNSTTATPTANAATTPDRKIGEEVSASAPKQESKVSNPSKSLAEVDTQLKKEIKSQPTPSQTQGVKTASDDTKQKQQEPEIKTAANTSKVNPSTTQPLKEEQKPAAINNNDRSSDVVKQTPQKQASDPAQKKQEDENKKSTSVTNNTISKDEPIKEERKSAATNVSSEKAKPQAKQAEVVKSSNDLNKKPKLDSLIETAIKAINTGNLQSALNLYNEVLTLNPTPQQEKAIYSEIIAIRRNLENAKPALSEASIPKTTAPVEKTVVQVPAPNLATPKAAEKTITNNTKSLPVSQNGGSAQNTSVPNSTNNRSAALNNQPSSPVQRDVNKEDLEFSKSITAQPALSYLWDSSNYVKLTCQGISSNGKNTYLKFLVQNNGNADFNVGSVQLTHIQNQGQLKKLNPRYILDSPTSASKKEFQLIVVAENQLAIEPDEVLIFEMEDLTKSTQLTLNIRGENFSGKVAKAF